MYKVFKQFVIYILVFVIILLMILIPLILSFSNKIEKPLRHLLHGSKTIENGNYGHKICSNNIVHSTIEIRELTHSFNSMSDKLSGVISELKISSTIDILSQLYNRRELLKLSNDLFKESINFKKSCAILMIDIDYFKKINDTYGHRSGDIAISMVASSIKSSITSTDIAGRYGGEEFMVFISDTTITLAEQIAQRIRINIQKLHIVNDQYEFSCTCSVGLLFLSDLNEPVTLESSIELADKALYEAKETGRNRVIIKEL